jgi:hypothetical protein
MPDTEDVRPVTRQLLVTVEVGRLGVPLTVGDWSAFTRVRNAVLGMKYDVRYSNDTARVTGVEQLPSDDDQKEQIDE